MTHASHILHCWYSGTGGKVSSGDIENENIVSGNQVTVTKSCYSILIKLDSETENITSGFCVFFKKRL